MPNYDQRTVLDYRFGQLTGGVDALATTLTSADFATLPSDLTTVKYVPLVLADDSQKLYEIVWVTGHSAGSTTVTVVRGREGSGARAWGAGTLWRAAPTTRDGQAVYANRAALPTDAHLGMRAFVQGEGTPVVKTALGWAASEPPFGHAGITEGFAAVGANGAYAPFAAAQDLTGGMTFSNSDDALIVPIAGRYLITVSAYVTGGSGIDWFADAIINSTALPPAATARAGARVGSNKATAGDVVLKGSVTRRLAAGDKLRLYHACNPASSYGSTGYDGAWLEALYVGP